MLTIGLRLAPKIPAGVSAIADLRTASGMHFITAIVWLTISTIEQCILLKGRSYAPSSSARVNFTLCITNFSVFKLFVTWYLQVVRGVHLTGVESMGAICVTRTLHSGETFVEVNVPRRRLHVVEHVCKRYGTYR